MAHQIALQSIVLLKNENDALPLDKDIKSVAVIGPNANFCRFGTYSGKPSNSNYTFRWNQKSRIPNAIITYSQGTTILETELPTMADTFFYAPDGDPGVKAEYFNGFDIKKEPDLVRLEKSPNISWEFEGTPDSTIFRPNFSP